MSSTAIPERELKLSSKSYSVVQIILLQKGTGRLRRLSNWTRTGIVSHPKHLQCYIHSPEPSCGVGCAVRSYSNRRNLIFNVHITTGPFWRCSSEHGNSSPVPPFPKAQPHRTLSHCLRSDRPHGWNSGAVGLQLY